VWFRRKLITMIYNNGRLRGEHDGIQRGANLMNLPAITITAPVYYIAAQTAAPL